MRNYIIFDGNEIKDFVTEEDTVNYVKEWAGFGKLEYEEKYDIDERVWIEKALNESCTDLECYNYNIENLFGDNNEVVELFENDSVDYPYSFEYDGKKYITDGVILKGE
jgi:hypothetical protein